jgi:hypothetical protein
LLHKAGEFGGLVRVTWIFHKPVEIHLLGESLSEDGVRRNLFLSGRRATPGLPARAEVIQRYRKASLRQGLLNRQSFLDRAFLDRPAPGLLEGLEDDPKRRPCSGAAPTFDKPFAIGSRISEADIIGDR